MKATDGVEVLDGVGKTRAKSLARLGINSVGDLLSYYPRAYQNRGDTHSIKVASLVCRNSTNPPPMSFIVTVATEPTLTTIRKKMTLLKFKCFDETGTIEITYFNQPFLKNTFRIGSEFRLWGRPKLSGGRLELTNPIYENAANKETLTPIVPVYRLTAGISQKYISNLIKEAIKECPITEFLPSELLKDNSLCQQRYAIQNIHFPNDIKAIATATRRLTFNEVFVMSCTLASNKNREQSGAIALKNSDIASLMNEVPYNLTNAQMRAIKDISNDMASIKPMCRILCGDVGSGKTIVAAVASYIAVNNGSRAAIMAPTEILAKQHYADLSELFAKLDIKVALLCGSMTAKEKKSVQESLKKVDGPKIVIGTHALLSDSVELEKFGLVITDEQHRFGVNQRATLREKTKHAHSLVMSATPIPRTLSLVIYGELDISRLDEMPPGRQKVSTFTVDESYRKRLEGFIRKQSEEGHATYIVCPTIEESENTTENPEELCDIVPLDFESIDEPPLKAAVQYAEELQKKLPDIGIGFIHGKMKASEKDAVMDSFISGEKDVLVSTTVIEVGVNVPRATLMIVENAERFGLSQLHQLRGRVGRGSNKSWCILVSDTHSEKSKQRLDIMCNSNDGFAIAEEDLKLRGPGDFLRSDGNIRQHGSAEMPFASSCSDTELVLKASEAARDLISVDPYLTSLPELKTMIETLRSNVENTIN